MKGVAGFREVQVLSNVSNGKLNVASSYIEVTNGGGSDVTIYVNDFPTNGHPTNGDPSKGILIKAGTTREIPMLVYNFVATGAVTVVAYLQ